MANNPTKILFFFILILGTLIAISSNSWLGAWMGLEINLLSFIPLMTNNKNLTTTEAALKYFLVQAIASATLLFSIIMLLLLTTPIMFIQWPINEVLISSTLLLKMGAAPLHFWFPGVMEGLNWGNSLTLMTWQKIAPLMLLSYVVSLNFFILMIIVTSMTVGAMGGLNQTSLRKILAYSSINHLGWLIAALTLSNSIWLLYFLVYMFLSATIVFSLNLFKIFHINQIFMLKSIQPTFKFFMLINFLSLGGLPPFLGFLPKWMVIQSLTQMNLIFLITVMVCLTLITLFYYLRVTFTAFMLSYAENMWITPSPSTLNLFIVNSCSVVSMSGLILITILMQLL
uniref:NADH dehydrogenase subunit 2 n=1 Tax=Rhopalopsole bulbifera TaxID=1926546 RepID=UPI0010C47AA0|nr:NADH dehydrogenase subunit 2 [Rhopalopsole bulbifera]QBR55133.1 NADH dehydrogenase subunit 2 [Rhopalopsole bulbifera]